jgi:chaperonin GroES
MGKHINVTPIGEMVLIRHGDQQATTRGGLLLPDSAKTEVLTGIVVGLSSKMEGNQHDYPYEIGDQILYDLRYRIPVDMMPGNKHFLVEAKWIYAVMKDISNELSEQPANHD